MSTPASPRPRYRFGLFEADPANGELRQHGVRVRLQDQPFRLLCLLLERAGEVVSKEELRDKIWHADTYVEFDGSLTAALKKLRHALGDSAESPVFIETVPKRGYRFVAPVEVLTTIVSAGKTTATDAKLAAPALRMESLTHAPRKTRASLWIGIAAASVLAAVGIAAYRNHNIKFAAAPKMTPRRALAVLGFHNVSGRPDDEWLSTAISEMFSTELAAGEKLRLVSGEEVVQLHLTMPWSQTSTLSPETTARIGTALNSDLLVLGSYTVMGSARSRQVRLDVRLQEVKTGQVLEEVAETGADQHLSDLVAMASAKLRDRLELPPPSTEEASASLALLPANVEAERFYSLGLLKMREYDYLSARDLLEQAVKADPKFSLAHSMLARAWEFLGYIDKAKSEAKIGLDLSQGLPRTNRMLAEAAFYQANAERAKGASIYRALYAMFPDNLDYGLQLSKLELDSYHNDQAMETLRQLRELPAPLRDDPRIDLRTAWTLYYKDRREALVFARSAASKASALGRRLIYAKARQTECDYSEGPVADVNPGCDESYQIFIAAGNNWEAAWSLVSAADHLRVAGNYSESNQMYEHTIQILRPIHAPQRFGAVLNNFAINVFNQGRLDRAEAIYREALQNFQAVGDKHNGGAALNNIADVLALRGRLDEAATMYRKGWESAEMALPQPGYGHYRYALVRLMQGKPEEALREADLPVEACRKLNKLGDMASALAVVGNIQMVKGDLLSSRKSYQEALETQTKIGNLDDAAESKFALAEVALAEGSPEKGETLVREAIAQLEKGLNILDHVVVYTTLSRILQAQGKLEDARKAIEHAAELVGANDLKSFPGVAIPVKIQQERVSGALAATDTHGQPRLVEARTNLVGLAATARRLGFFSFECDARIALGELEMKINPDAGRRRLTSLATDARDQGFGLIATKAAALQNQTAAQARPK